jgi:chromosome segregation ATPase
MTPDVRARINDDIKVINDLMTKNKKEIGWLRRQMKESNLKIDAFNKMIDTLNIQIGERDKQIASLKDDLTKMNFSVASLNASMDTIKAERAELKSTIQDKTNTLNTAWYITGNQKELLADNIIIKEGGVIGINSTTVLKEDFNNSKFSKIDITQLKDINLNSKKVKLVTNHPAGSYLLNQNKDGLFEKLEITNPEKFWSTSKYLVVIVN